VCENKIVPCTTHVECNDNDPCTYDACISQKCTYSPQPCG
jgi:hypothetical protein